MQLQPDTMSELRKCLNGDGISIHDTFKILLLVYFGTIHAKAYVDAVAFRSRCI